MKPNHRTVALFAIPLALSVATGADAWNLDAKTAGMLPNYCKYTMLYRDGAFGSKDPNQIKHWERVMGSDNFMHMHHYCKGLDHTNRALYTERNEHGRNQHLRFSIREFDYVLKNVRADFALLPEIRTKKAENLLRLGEGPQAALELGLAIKLRPDYWPPYAVLSDLYKEQRDLKQARLWLERGLAATGDASPLKRRLTELQ